MTQFRDWPRTLRQASYRGVAFFIEEDQLETGRRLVVHEFPLADAPYVEDLGRAANKFDVTAYVVADDADRRAEALLSACDKGGAATLSLPIGSYRAHCEKARRTFKKDKLGYIAFTLTFVRDGTGSGVPALPSGFLAQAVSWAAAGVAGPLGAMLASRVATTGMPDFVTASAEARIVDAAATLDGVLRRVPLDANLGPPLLGKVAGLAAEASSLASFGGVGDAWTATSFAATAAAGTSSLVPRLDGIVTDTLAAAPLAAGAAAMRDMAAYGL